MLSSLPRSPSCNPCLRVRAQVSWLTVYPPHTEVAPRLICLLAWQLCLQWLLSQSSSYLPGPLSE